MDIINLVRISILLQSSLYNFKIETHNEWINVFQKGSSYHDGKGDGCFLDALDDPEDDETEDLYEGKQVHFGGADMS